MIVMFVLLTVVLLAGAIGGSLAVIAVGIHREEKARSLGTKSRGWAASAARAACGSYIRTPTILQPASHWQDIPTPVGLADGSDENDLPRRPCGLPSGLASPNEAGQAA
jgi:hypothetical protein